MAQIEKDDPSKYPALGLILNWVDKKGSDKKLVWLLILACIVVVALDWTYKKYGHFEIEYYKGFYAAYGFVMFTALIFAARGLRVLIKRPEDYYGNKAIDQEEYPEDQLDKQEHMDG